MGGSDSYREDRDRSGSRRDSKDRDRSRDRKSRDSRDRKSSRDRSRDRKSRDRKKKHRSRSRSPSRSASPPRRRRRKKSNFSDTAPPGAIQTLPDGAQPPIPGVGIVTGGVSSMMMPGMGMIDQNNKVARELFVGNTPPTTNEAVLMDFLNAAMKQVNLVTSPGNPILSCRVSNKFAFIEVRSVEEANNCLSLTGIPFMGNMLKVGRPTKYTGPPVPASTWQQLTGQIQGGGMIDPTTKVYRELFVGNTTDDMNEVELQEFLGAAMQRVGLTVGEGSPILSTRLSGKYAFVELRSIDETNNMLNLNGIPYMGQNLRVGRPSKYSGPSVPHLDWNELLTKFMNGELQPSIQAGGNSTRVVRLANMVTEQELQDMQEYTEIVEDTTEECGRYGKVMSLAIPRAGEPGTGLVFVEFENTDGAAAAFKALDGRTFDGRRVEVSYFDENKFKAR